MYHCSLFSSSSPAFVIWRIFDDSHSDRCEVINNVEHLSICLLASCMSSLEKYLFASSPLFKSDYLVFVIELHELFIYLGPVILYKKLPDNAGDTGNTALMPGSGRSPGEGNGSPLWCCCLRNPMERDAWQATVHRVTKSQKQLKQLRMHGGL